MAGSSRPSGSRPARKGPDASSGGSSSSIAGQRKMGSLSSTQLSFTTSATTRQPAQDRAGNSRSNTAAAKREEDKKAMPPPLLPVKKDKGKAKEPIIVDDDSDDERSSPHKRHATASEQLWADLYGPKAEAELAPGKQRVARVKNWLHEAIYGQPFDSPSGLGESSQAARDRIRKYRRILLVTGPAGIGKTTTVRLLAETMGIELVEWTEGVDEWSLGDGFDRESSLTKLSSFLSRGAYPALAMSGHPSSSAAKPRVLLLTSLPNISHLPTRDAFHAALLTFCQSYTSAGCPLVIVHSDSGAGGRAEESWMDRERGGREGALAIIGKAVKEGPWCQEVEFLPLAPTFLTRALQRVIGLALDDPKRHPSKAAIQLVALSANGDLRSAINSVQLLCTKTQQTSAKRRKLDGGNAPPERGKGSRGGRGANLGVSSELRAV